VLTCQFSVDRVVRPRPRWPSAVVPGHACSRLTMEVGDEPVERPASPVSRARCNTWHAGLDDDDITPAMSDHSLTPAARGVKRPARRNAWGAASYADLIAAAIESSPEKRLTLSQIYDWMVTNVQYFSERADSGSSAGWKVIDMTI